MLSTKLIIKITKIKDVDHIRAVKSPKQLELHHSLPHIHKWVLVLLKRMVDRPEKMDGLNLSIQFFLFSVITETTLIEDNQHTGKILNSSKSKNK